MNALLLVLVGAVAALHAATWGAFKDAPFEGFRTASFVRSIGLGVASALLLGAAGVVRPSSGLLVAIGACYACERLATEWWKTIVREDSQSAYSIPMRLAVRGRPVNGRLPRYAAGAVIAVGLVGAYVAVSDLQVGPSDPWWATLLVVGLGGWLTAFGGAWKDAPIEGFQLAKFFRSPVVATAWGGVLLAFSSNLPVLVLAAGGLSVITIETYKTFLAGGPPGKFAGKPVLFASYLARSLSCAAHAATYGLLVCALAVTLLRQPVDRIGDLGRDAALLAAMVWAGAFGALVLRTFKSATVETSQGSGGPTELSGRLSDADIRRASI